MRSTSIFRAGLFANQVCLITGGGTGIGRAIATECASLGASIMICGRRPEPIEKTVKELRQDGNQIHGMRCDIRNDEDVVQLVKTTLDSYGKIDVLINNAGGQFPSPAATLSNNGFEAVIRNNLIGTWKVTRCVAVEAMIPAKQGRIVNITADTRSGFPGMSHTGAARAGVENLTKSLAIEWVEHGIRVNAVAPGIVETEAMAQYPEELIEGSRRATPLRRLAAPEEISHLAVYLASRFADFITGQIFRIDGGKSLWGESWPIPMEVPQHGPYDDAATFGPKKNAKRTDKK